MTPYVEVMSDLLKGQECAAKLNDLLKGSTAAAGEILNEILNTFSSAISALDAVKNTAAESDDGKSEVIAGGGGGGVKRKGGGGNQRGGCRRRTQQSDCRTVRTKTAEDGRAWRKYGQKDIHNSKNPRSYFRCTHKFDQHCLAQKQVQRSEEDPTTFLITYIGDHTCSDPLTVPYIIENSDPKDSCLINFASKTSTATTTTTTTNSSIVQDAPFGSTLVVQQVLKQEGEEEVLSSLTPGSSPAENVAVKDSGEAAIALGQFAADQGDVTSSFFMDGSFVYEDFLEFDQ